MFLLLWCVLDLRGRSGPAARESIMTHVRNHKTEHLKTSTFTLFMTLAKCKPVMAIFADHLLVPSRTLWVTAFMWPEWLFSSQQKMALNLIKDSENCDETTCTVINGSTFECNRHSIHYFDNPRETPLDSLSIYLSNSNISGLSQTRCFMRSCIAVITDCALSSAPCFELFSAAPAKHTTI